MKKFRKLLSLVLAMVMVLAMAAPSFAANGNSDSQKGTISISGALEGQEYKLYKIFDLKSYNYTDDNEQQGQYSYKVVEAWENFIADPDYSAYFTLEDGYLINNSGMTDDAAKDFAQAALAYATERKITPVGTYTTVISDENVTVSAEGDAYTIKIENLDLGYYLLDSSVGALCSLDTTNPAATIQEKNGSIPTIDKEIIDEDGGSDSNSASIGDTVNFEVRIAVKPGAQNYALLDEMGDGLSYTEDSVEVYLVDSEDAVVVPDDDTVIDTKYTVTTTDIGSYDLKVAFADDYVKDLAGKYLVVRYSATITEDAVINGEGNSNKATLEYGDNKITVESETVTYVYDVDVFKYTGEKAPLANATFTLKDAMNTPVRVKYDRSENNIEIYKVTTADLTGPEITDKEAIVTTEITTSDTGKFRIEGLAAGTYQLEETAAPDGYNKLTSAITVVIAEENRTDYVAGETLVNGVAVSSVDVENKTGALLPSTGGIGTTIFYAAGIVLMAGAVFFVVRRKRA